MLKLVVGQTFAALKYVFKKLTGVFHANQKSKLKNQNQFHLNLE